MYRRIYQVPVRSEWSEFSLRSRPPKIRKFQAGTSNGCEEELCLDIKRKTERNLLEDTKPALRSESKLEEDSIEYDVFTISMSYAEGRQRMLERINAVPLSNHSNRDSSIQELHSGNNSSKRKNTHKRGSLGTDRKSQSSTSKAENKCFASRSLYTDKLKTSRKEKWKEYKSQGHQKISSPLPLQLGTESQLTEDEDERFSFTLSPRKNILQENNNGQDASEVYEEPESSPMVLEQSEAMSRSPAQKKIHGRKKFTIKDSFEKRPPRFTLKDILGRDTEAAQCQANRDEQTNDLDIGISAEPAIEQIDVGESSNSQLNIDDPFTNNVEAWIEELGSQEDSSLLAMLESPMVGVENSYSTDTEEDDDARYYYENMLNSADTEHGTVGKFWLNGSLVWGKLSKTRWWPSVVIDGPMAGQKIARVGWTWLMWFGDHKISQMRQTQVVSFAHEFRNHCRGKLSSSLEAAIIEALKECANRSGIVLDSYNDVKRWGLQEMGFLNIVEGAGKDVDPFIPKTGSEFPPVIVKELRKLRREAEGSDYNSDVESSLPNEQSKLNALTNSRCFESDVLKDVDFCLSCAKHDRKIVCEHPVFVGYVCSKCKDSLMESLLALDDDGCNLFCTVCGEGGELFVCEEKDCGRSFCGRCMKHYLSTDALKIVRGRSPWLCFLCTEYSSESHGVLVPRECWRDELVKFYNPVFDQVSTSCDTIYFTGRKLRVLSLFDGIGCVRVALEQLQLDVEVYYASESDVFAQHLTMFNHGFSVLHLGDINSLSKEKLQEICPIDLVVACPPSEDLDVTNREYEGFNGSGILMLKFLMILKDLETICKGNNSVYWLVQGTAAMKSEYRSVLSNFFQSDPSMWDAQFFSPYVCPKLIWGNIPRLYSALQYYKDKRGQETSLDSYLAANVNRTALVEKLRNCAIDYPSVNQTEDKDDGNVLDKDGNNGETEVNTGETLIVEKKGIPSNTMYSLPVLMDGKKTNVWIGEVERVLGLPLHYTDVSRLSLSQRQKLLKKAPSVLVLKHLLSPLTDIFLTQT